MHLNEFNIAFSFTNDLVLRVAINSSTNFFLFSLYYFFNETEICTNAHKTNLSLNSFQAD